MTRGILLAISVCVVTGCAHLPRVSIPQARATAPQDPGSPATVAAEKTVTSLPIAAGSIVEVTQPEKSGAMGEQLAQPVIKTTLSQPSVLSVVAEHHAASTGTVDTTVAVRRVDNAARQPLLFAAIGAIVCAGAFLFLKYPTPALMCGAAGVVFFLAWQIASLPSWMIGVGAVAAGGALFLYFGHERGEKTLQK